ncbi:MAG: radical SAM protein, partial [Treponema sp.]|nr:radical SAM protein [Treponema sp.]
MLKPLDAVLVKTSLVDFPERVAAACFLPGCNLRCPYCYNTELVEHQEASQAKDGGDKKIVGASPTMTNAASHVIAARDAAIFISIDQVIAHLKKRANVLSGFVISGGEPLCHPDVVRDLILEARSLGYKIKLDTNGSFPDRLQQLLDDPAARPDYIALDVKTSPARYKDFSQ